MRAFWVLFLMMITQSAAWAYIVAVPRAQAPLDFARPVHILLAGRGENLGTQPQQAAMTRGVLYRRNFPDEQIVLISVLEYYHKDNGALDRRILDDAGWDLIVDNETKLATESAMAEILKFTRIRSLEFWAHSSAGRGVSTDDDKCFEPDGKTPMGCRLDFRYPVIDQLQGHFDDGAWAGIYGCNGGWVHAQRLSKLWGVAFSGAFTETQFEHLYSDGHFYIYDDKEAPKGEWADGNADLGIKDCDDGGCLRMRPDDNHYWGHWGNFKGAFLSHYKFFCALDERDCEKRMARSLYGFVAEKSLRRNSTYEDFQRVAKEALCPLSKDRKVTKACFQELDLIAKGKGNRYIYFEAPTVNDNTQSLQLTCDFMGCEAKIVCTDVKCLVADQVGKGSTTLADEYLHYLRGYQWLKEDGL